MVDDIVSQLKRDEGEVLEVYLDSRGIRTAGVGHNIDAHGPDLPVGTAITQDQSDQWLQQDIADATRLLYSHLPWIWKLSSPRLGVLVNMAFNLGVAGLLGFHRTLSLMEQGDYVGASGAMLQSAWATQVGPRASRLSQQLRTDQWV